MVGGCWFVVRPRFRNLFSIEIDNEPVRHTDLVRGAVVERDASHKRRLKPAAMLIGRLEIHVGGIAQFGMQRANGFVRNAAVDPNIDRVVAFRCAWRKVEFARKIDIVQLKPNVRAALRDEIGEFPNNFRVENCFSIF